MNEDDADQGTGLDTKYRIDSAQGESLFDIPLSLLYSLSHPLLYQVTAVVDLYANIFSDASALEFD